LEKRWNRGALAALIVLLLLAFLLPSVSASPINDRKQELNDIKKDIKNAEQALKNYEAEQKRLEAEIEALEKNIQKIRQELTRLAQQIKTTEQEIKVTEAELLDAEARLAQREDFLNRRIRAIYEMGRVSYLQVILEAHSFSDFLTRFSRLQRIVDKDTYLLEVVQQERQEIVRKKEGLEKKRSNLMDMRRQSLDKKNQLEKETARKEALLAAAQDKYEEQERFIREMEKEAQEIEKIIKQLEEEARRQAASREPVGQLLWPVPGYSNITSPYGYRIHPITGQPGSFHGGIDIGAPRGAVIRAAASGTAYSYYSPSYGNYIIIIHGGGVSTLYAHNSANLVSQGQNVARGDTIAYVGSTGMSTGPHLHFEVRENGIRVNPMNYFR
jgi:murein DD-endopeptidase MepM/ murein hydrolase activator NlpD